MKMEKRTTVLSLVLVLVVAAFIIPTTVATKPGANMTNGGGMIVNMNNESHFDFNVKDVSGIVTGHLNYDDPANALSVDSINVTMLTVTGNTATFTGFATINGTGAFPFTVMVMDNSKNGKTPTPDMFMITIDAYTRDENLTAGNIQINP